MSVLASNATNLDNLTGTDPYSGAAPSALIVVKVTYYTAASVVATIGNGLLMATVWQRNALRKVSYFLVANLALKDFTFAFVSSVLVMPSVFKDRWVFGHHLCILFGFISTWLAYVEALTLVCLAGDRYVAVTKPLRYRQILNKKKFRAAVAFCWSYSFIWAAMPLVGFGEYVYCDNLKICQLNWSPDDIPYAYTKSVGILLFFPATGVIIYCYVKIYRSLKKVSNVPVFTIQAQTNGDEVTSTVPKTIKGIFTLALITGVYFFCWFPFVGIRLSRVYYHDFPKALTLQAIEDFTLYSFTIANFINPIIYGVYNREFRYEFVRFIKTGRSTNNQVMAMVIPA